MKKYTGNSLNCFRDADLIIMIMEGGRRKKEVNKIQSTGASLVAQGKESACQ